MWLSLFWTDYISCTSKEPSISRYNEAFNRAVLRDSLPIPGILGDARVAFRTVRGIRNGLSLRAALVTAANIQTLAGGAILHVTILTNPSVETRELREAAKPAMERCAQEAQNRYGVTLRYR